MAGIDFSAAVSPLMQGIIYNNKKKEEYEQQLAISRMMSQMAVKDGSLTKINPDVKDKAMEPLFSQKAVDQIANNANLKRSEKLGQLKALTGIGEVMLRHQITQGIQDERTKQIIGQEETMFPLDVEQKKAQTKHLQKITEDEGKVNVPGFGLMTPAQYSAHLARQERMDVLKKKSEPILSFENQLKSAYGVGIQDIVNAAQPQKFKDVTGKKEYTGTPYYDVNGAMVDSATAARKPQDTFVLAGPNKAMVPLLAENGLGWKQIVPKAKSFAGEVENLKTEQTTIDTQNKKLQAQKIIDANRGVDPKSLTPEDKVALDWANGIIGQ